MSEPKASRKKVIGRKVAIVLGIIGIILVVDLGVVLLIRHPQTSHPSGSTLWINYESITQPANSYTNWTFYPPYAGNVTVVVGAAGTPDTYIRIIYHTKGLWNREVTYDNQVWCGWDSLNAGMGTFPVLPTPIEIRVGNTGNYPNTILVYATYYY